MFERSEKLKKLVRLERLEKIEKFEQNEKIEKLKRSKIRTNWKVPKDQKVAEEQLKEDFKDVKARAAWVRA